MHVCRKYPISKFGAEEESARWDSICKKLNGHIQYRRSSCQEEQGLNQYNITRPRPAAVIIGVAIIIGNAID